MTPRELACTVARMPLFGNVPFHRRQLAATCETDVRIMERVRHLADLLGDRELLQ